LEEREEKPMAGTERQRELRRRRHRSKKIAVLARKKEKATKTEKAVIAEKLRKLTPGGAVIAKAWGL
jgi:hypothetical protein